MESDRAFEVLHKIASDIAPVGAARIAAMITNRNNILSLGINERKSHPFQSRYSRNPDSIYWHAETRAIFNALKSGHKDILKNSTLYICRLKYNVPARGKLICGLAAPCDGCSMCIEEYGIRKIIYTTDPVEGYKFSYQTLIR